MKIFKELKKLGYIHYSITTIGELDNLPLNSAERVSEQALVLKWFREKYDLFGCIDLHVCTPAHWYIRVDDIILNDYVYHSEDEDLRFNSYEEAELACLKKLIEICNKLK
jgi:hypothetical protein